MTDIIAEQQRYNPFLFVFWQVQVQKCSLKSRVVDVYQCTDDICPFNIKTSFNGTLRLLVYLFRTQSTYIQNLWKAYTI